ncbi:hypothetical protein KBY64_01610 [Synechococcus lacustris L1E-Slac]|nr:hypothetical protein [Synechococcus lacustris]MCP9812983.1 hypothetical protein [Synechococcus lacustris L1E-Slac]
MEIAAHVFMQHAADQGLIRDTLLQGPRADCLEIAAGEADVDALILLARCPGRPTQRLDYPRGLAVGLQAVAAPSRIGPEFE